MVQTRAAVSVREESFNILCRLTKGGGCQARFLLALHKRHAKHPVAIGIALVIGDHRSCLWTCAIANRRRVGLRLTAEVGVVIRETGGKYQARSTATHHAARVIKKSRATVAGNIGGPGAADASGIIETAMELVALR